MVLPLSFPGSGCITVYPYSIRSPMKPDSVNSDVSPSRLLDQVRAAIRVRHYSLRTEQAYVHWVVRFIRHCGMRHPRELGAREVSAYLSYLASERDVAAATQQQALSALTNRFWKSSCRGWMISFVRRNRHVCRRCFMSMKWRACLMRSGLSTH